jgi:hypothetical protein
MKRAKTPTFLIEVPLKLDGSTEKPLRAHLEAARCLSNALLGAANRRMRAMRTAPGSPTTSTARWLRHWRPERLKR